jgi:hypothetical protein
LGQEVISDPLHQEKIPSRDLLFFFNNLVMVKAIGLILIIVGAVGLVLGVPGVFGSNLVNLNPWALAILGFVFFGSGIGLLKATGETNEQK